MNLGTDLLPFTKTNSKWITDLHIKHKTIDFLEVNTAESLDNLEYGGDILDTTLQVRSLKEITDKLDFIKIRNFL